jgi:hypothetical protein
VCHPESFFSLPFFRSAGKILPLLKTGTVPRKIFAHIAEDFSYMREKGYVVPSGFIAQGFQHKNHFSDGLNLRLEAKERGVRWLIHCYGLPLFCAGIFFNESF